MVARTADGRGARTTYRDDSYVRRRSEREEEEEGEGEGERGENARASPRKRRSAVDGSSRARTTGLSCAFLGVTDVVAVRHRCAARTGGVVHEVVLCARVARVGPGPRQRSLAKACGAIPREHAEPGHEEVRAS